MQNSTFILRPSLWLIGTLLFTTALSSNTVVAQNRTGERHLVDVNTADVKTLEALPGIGSTLANRIVEGRPYKDVSDLEKVKGLTPSKLKPITNQITFGSSATASKGTSKSKKTTTSSTSAGEKSSSVAQQPPPKNSQDKPVSPTGSSSGRMPAGQTVNINTATLEQLDALPGIGPSKAQAVIDYRNEHGRFNSIEDIQNVKGIKEGEFSKIKDLIRVK